MGFKWRSQWSQHFDEWLCTCCFSGRSREVQQLRFHARPPGRLWHCKGRLHCYADNPAQYHLRGLLVAKSLIWKNDAPLQPHSHHLHNNRSMDHRNHLWRVPGCQGDRCPQMSTDVHRCPQMSTVCLLLGLEFLQALHSNSHRHLILLLLTPAAQGSQVDPNQNQKGDRRD